MATHSNVLAWRISGTGEPGGLPSMGSHRVGHDWSDLAAAAADSRIRQNHEQLYMYVLGIYCDINHINIHYNFYVCLFICFSL